MNFSGSSYKKGDFIGQKYEVYDILGEGGFGIVYLVYSHDTKSVYALKTFRNEYIEDTYTRERFRKEAQVWINLERYPFIVPAYFVDDIADRLFIAMEYIAPNEQGLNALDTYLKYHPPDLAQSLHWAIQFCYGMEYAYSRGILAHRDIKPANIMIDHNKIVKITDFGLASIIGSKATLGVKLGIRKGKIGFSCQTMEGVGFGTPSHMPPEQFINATDCDEKSDIYSFGVVLYQMATGGKLPFLPSLPKNDSYEESRRFWLEIYKLHCQAPVPKLSSPLFPVIRECLEKKPRKRYQSFKELRTDLEVILRRQTGEVVNPPQIKELAAWELNNKGMSLLILGKDEEAKACFDKASVINPIDISVWSIKGLNLAKNGKYQEAIACYDKALAINPRYEVTWDCKGDALRKLGRYQEAISCYDKAIGIKPIYALGWYHKGIALTMICKHYEAISCYNKALEINPLYKDTWVSKAFALDELRSYQEALICCNRALELNPDHELAWYKKGVVLDNLGEHQVSIACFDKALEINPMLKEAWLSKGATIVKLGKYQDAIGCYEQTLQIDPIDVLAWHNKGTILIILNKYTEALFCFSEALRINPNYADVLNNKRVALTTIINALQGFIKLTSTMDEKYIQMAKKIIRELEANL